MSPVPEQVQRPESVAPAGPELAQADPVKPIPLPQTGESRGDLTLYFELDVDLLSAAEKQRLASHVQPFRSNAASGSGSSAAGGWLVTGHTDSTHTPAYNQGLAQRRAQTVRTQLLSLGWPAEQIRMRWWGQTRPAASNDTEQGRALNRRVDLRWQDTWESPRPVHGQQGQEDNAR